MNQGETIALFERSEAVRAEAKAEAVAEGKPDQQARLIAHEAAKSVWNGWANPMLAKRQALEASDRWIVKKDLMDDIQPGNEETRQWMEAAKVDFSNLRLNLAQNAERSEAIGTGPEDPVSQVLVGGKLIDFSWFVFPGQAGFLTTQFHADVSFESAVFGGDAWRINLPHISKPSGNQFQLIFRNIFGQTDRSSPGRGRISVSC